jgi:ferredoxin
MRFDLDLDKCEDHAQCVYAAPRLFSLDSTGRQSLRATTSGTYRSGEIDPAEADALDEAADVCPVQAITLIHA